MSHIKIKPPVQKQDLNNTINYLFVVAALVVGAAFSGALQSPFDGTAPVPSKEDVINLNEKNLKELSLFLFLKSNVLTMILSVTAAFSLFLALLLDRNLASILVSFSFLLLELALISMGLAFFAANLFRIIDHLHDQYISLQDNNNYISLLKKGRLCQLQIPYNSGNGSTDDVGSSDSSEKKKAYLLDFLYTLTVTMNLAVIAAFGLFLALLLDANLASILVSVSFLLLELSLTYVGSAFFFPMQLWMTIIGVPWSFLDTVLDIFQLIQNVLVIITVLFFTLGREGSALIIYFILFCFCFPLYRLCSIIFFSAHTRLMLRNSNVFDKSTERKSNLKQCLMKLH